MKSPDNPNSSLVNAEAIGISEAFNFHAPATNCSATSSTECFADLLYGATPQMTCTWARGASCGCAARGDPCYRCRTTRCKFVGQRSPALAHREPAALEYLNGQSLPDGLADARLQGRGDGGRHQVQQVRGSRPLRPDLRPFPGSETPDQTVARVRAQGKHEPLVLRANEGDCINVTLTNKLTQNWLTQHGNA